MNKLKSGLYEHIKNWKIKYANIKESNQNNLAELNKNYEAKLISDRDKSFKKEETFKKTIEDNENKIWKIKHEGDLN